MTTRMAEHLADALDDLTFYLENSRYSGDYLLERANNLREELDFSLRGAEIVAPEYQQLEMRLQDILRQLQQINLS
jgi:hypothetical protein